MKNHLNKQTEESAAEKMTAREREDDKGGEEEKEDPEIRMTLPGALPPLNGRPGLAKQGVRRILSPSESG